MILFSLECPAGTYGVNCSEACPEGYYGRLCKDICPLQCDQTCDVISGECPGNVIKDKTCFGFRRIAI